MSDSKNSMRPFSCFAIEYDDGHVFVDSSIRTESELSQLICPGRNARIRKVTVSEHKKRSLDANALQAVWIREISDYTGESIKYVRSTIKRDFGLPVLRYEADTEDEKVASKRINWTLGKIGYDAMTPAQQLNVIEQFSVTSILTTRQHKKMLDDVCNHYANHGLILTNERG